LAFSGYTFDTPQECQALAEPGQGETFRFGLAFAKRTNAHVVYGFPEEDRGRLYNSAALVGPAGAVGIYRKVHLFGRERACFSSGEEGFPVWETPVGRLGIMICFDWYFPEAARTLALAGAELLLHPSNLVLPHGPQAMITRCLENRVFAATANRVGSETGVEQSLTFIGQSQVVSPQGELLVRLGTAEESVGVADVDLSRARDKRLVSGNDLFAERRPSLYRLRK
jgi:predicted amidohydrolase